MLIHMRPSLGLITMLRGFEAEGGRPDELLGRFGLSLEQLDPARMVMRTLESAVHDEMARQVSLEQQGMRIGKHFSMAGYGLYVMLLMNCATVRQLLEMGVAYQNLTFLFSRLRLKPGPTEIGLVLELEGVAEDTWRFRIDEEMSGTYKLISDMRNALALPAQTFRVSLPFAAPADPEVLQEYLQYYGQTVEFNSEKACIWIENEVLEWQIPSSDPAALEVHRLQCDQVLSQYEQQVSHEGEWTLQVRMLMELLQGGIPDAATVAKALKPTMQVVGVQTVRFPAMFNAIKHTQHPQGTSTIAEGIAVGTPGRITQEIIAARVNDLVLVDEGDIEHAIVMLLEIEKTLVEGAGAAGLAALVKHPDRFRGKKVGLVLCGGNIDPLLLAAIIERGMVRAGRLARVRVGARDVPGSLARITGVVSEAGANIDEVHHQRAFTTLSAQNVEIELVIQTRGRDHIAAVLAALHNAGFDAQEQK